MPTASVEDFDIEFVHQPSDTLLCPVCHEVCKDAMITTACSHSFCTACIYQSVQVEPSNNFSDQLISFHGFLTHQPNTPGESLNYSLLDLYFFFFFSFGSAGLHPNLALANIISELNVYCRNKKYGCSTVVRLDALAHHITYCIYAPAECDNKGLGCSWQGTVQSAANHLNDCVYEKLKAFIEANNARVQRLEGIVLTLHENTGSTKRDRTVTYDGEKCETEIVSEYCDSTCFKFSQPSFRRSIRICYLRLLFFFFVQTSDPAPLISSSPNRKTFPEGGALVYEEEETDIVDGNEETWPHGDIECRRTISEYSCGVTSLAYSRGLIYSGAHDGSTKVSDLVDVPQSAFCQVVLHKRINPIDTKTTDHYVDWINHGCVLIVTFVSFFIPMQVFNVDTGELINSLHGHQMSVWALAVDPASGRFFSAGSDGTIK
ncbi:hypothetical protein BC937DRAFT_94765, partial [Endogone sp. FLAS-F59071]